MMTPQEIIREVQMLPANAQREIVDTLSQTLKKSEKQQPPTEAEIAQMMLESGAISEIPPDWNKPDDDDFEPIEIKGKPLSETILEDRN